MSQTPDPGSTPEDTPDNAPDTSPTAAITAPAPAMPASWRPLPFEASQTAMIGGTFFGLLLGLGGAFVVGWPLMTIADLDVSWWQRLLVMGLAWLAFGALGATFGYRRWKFTAWKLDDAGLHLRRGRAWRKEVLVPRSRVQHLDIERGPIERRYGLATLIVHTAGTRQHALRIAGLDDGDAVALRDALVPDPGHHDDVL